MSEKKQEIPKVEIQEMKFPLDWIPFDMGDNKPLVKRKQMITFSDNIRLEILNRLFQHDED
jgi:hypothetical protein